MIEFIMQEKNSNAELVSFVEYDKELNLEDHSIFRKAINLFFVPILNNLPKNFKHHIKKTDTAASEVIDNVTTHNALEVLYNKGKSFSHKTFLEKFFRYIWFSLGNSKAVRNRLKLVQRELREYLRLITKYKKEVHIISIAAGSSRAIIEAINHQDYLKDVKLSITFLDKNAHAIEYSKKLSVNLTHPHVDLEWIQDTVGSFLTKQPTKKFDVVEIVGLLDYFDDKKVTETFEGIYHLLHPDGILITANINHNEEEVFVTRIIDWPMVYRTPKELAVLAQNVGFKYNKMKVFYEPLKVHGLLVAQK